MLPQTILPPSPSGSHSAVAERRVHARKSYSVKWTLVYGLVLLASLVLFGLMMRAESTHAATIYLQPVNSSYMEGNYTASFTVDAPMTPRYLEFYAGAEYNGSFNVSAVQLCFDNTNDSSCGDDGGYGSVYQDRGITSHPFQLREDLEDSYDDPIVLTLREADMELLRPGDPYELTPGNTYYIQINTPFLATDVSTRGNGTLPYIYLSDEEPLDPNTISQSQVLAITEPGFGETVASTTLDVSFEYIVKDDGLGANGFEIAARKIQDPYGITYFTGNLADHGMVVGIQDTITQSITVPYEGSYELSVRLIGYSPDDPLAPRTTVDVGKMIGFNAIVGDYAFPTTTPGRTYTIYSAESCVLDWDLDFNLGDCFGYLFQPGPEVWSKYQTLTLRQSFPFSYAYQFPAIKDALYANPNLENQEITVPFMDGELTFISRDMVAAVPYAPLIREMLSYFMWFLLAYALYRMIITAHDTQTRV